MQGVREQPAKTYIGLDVVRFAAAMAVAFYHIGYWSWLPSVSKDNIKLFQDLSPIAPFIKWGWVGVPVFFVISGFVIARSAENRSPAAFAKGRVTRLYPAAWICATISLLMIGVSRDTLLPYFNSLILYPAGPWISGVYWTLGVEIMFYLAVFVCLLYRIHLMRLADAIGFISTAYWVFRLVDFATGGHAKPFFALFEGTIGGLTLVSSGCYFALGMTLFAMANGMGKTHVLRSMLFTLAALIALTSSGRFYVAQSGGARWEIVVPALMWMAGILAIVASVFSYGDRRSLFGLPSGSIRTIGLMTYPLYLVHTEIGAKVMTSLQAIGILALPIAIVVVILVAFAVLNIEMKVQRFLNALLANRRTRTAGPSQLP